jgi:hypothetical protein
LLKAVHLHELIDVLVRVGVRGWILILQLLDQQLQEVVCSNRRRACIRC